MDAVGEGEDAGDLREGKVIDGEEGAGMISVRHVRDSLRG
jgi:hypothetical protein